MARTTALMKKRKKIALVAHDNMKTELLDWAKYNLGTLGQHEIFGTGTTGRLLDPCRMTPTSKRS